MAYNASHIHTQPPFRLRSAQRGANLVTILMPLQGTLVRWRRAISCVAPPHITQAGVGLERAVGVAAASALQTKLARNAWVSNTNQKQTARFE